MAIEKASIEQLQQRADIYEVVSQYVELRRSGANFVARCPFHNENTPSFIVNPQRNIFKCFGCGEGGDSIGFLMKIENLSYAEAVEKLAYICNFTLTYTSKNIDTSISDDLAKIVGYYKSKLNANILQYLHNRGINDESIKRFALGYSGDGAEFMAFLRSQKMSFDKLLEVGVIGRDKNKEYARFSNRIMFPIFAPNGKAVGFGGRIISGDKFAKYINSPQSKIFNKSRLLYGYNIAKDSIFKQRQIIITEGYIDVVMLHQVGFTNAVATLGTALTQSHLPLISRGEVDILLCYDGDSAGISAAFKASMLLANKSGGVVIFDGGKDPADMVSEGKIDDLRRIFKTPIPFIKFVIQTIANRFDLRNPLQKEKALREIFSFMKNLSPILRDEYKGFIANALQIAPHLLGNFSAKTTSDSKQKNAKNPPNPPTLNSANNAEAILLKSILEDNSLLDFALEYLSDGIFTQKEAFLALKSGDLGHKALLGIAIDEHIKALNYVDFREQMRLFILNAYVKMLEQMRHNGGDSSDKIKSAVAINAKINLLKKGTLVRYEDM